MARKHGADANLPGNSRNPLDFRGAERELNRGQVVIAPPPPFQERSPLAVSTIMGFAWAYLARHYDRFIPTELSPGKMGWAPLHQDMWKLACLPDEKVAIAAPRHHAKSTCITLAYGLASILFRVTDYLIIVSDTFEGQAVEHIREYSRELSENEDLITDFRIKKLVKNVEGDLIIKFEDGGLARVKALGMEGAVRGLKWRDKRPGLFIIDDAENPELVESESRRKKSLNWIMNDLIPAGRKGAKVRMVGTILHFDSALARFCRPEASKSWTYKVYRAHRSFDDFSEILWPEMWPEQALRARRQDYLDQNNADGYSQEYLNDPISPVDAYFRQDDLQPCEARDLKTHGDYYIGWTSPFLKEEGRDYTAASVWKVLESGQKIKVLAIRQRLDAKEIIEQMFELEITYRPQVHFVEKGTIERSIEPFLDTRMREDNLYLNIQKITRNKDKWNFARPLQAMVRRHDLTFNTAMDLWPTVQEEYLRFPRAPHDDIVDSDSIIAQGLREIRTTLTTDEREEEDYFGRFGQFLREQQGRNATTGY